MFVIADIEWITGRTGDFSPTQIAAIKVDSNWQVVDCFESFMKPRSAEYYDWKNIAYTGGRSTDFINAKSAYNTLNNFETWLDSEDVILWWDFQSMKQFKLLIQRFFKTQNTHKNISINKIVSAFLNRQECVCADSYEIAKTNGIIVNSKLQHYALNDVHVIRDLIEKINFPQDDFLNPLPKSQTCEIKRYKEHEYPLLLDTEKNIIHKKGCSIIASTEIHIKGFSTWKTPLKEKYIPCECCEKEYYDALKQRNIEIIQKSQYTYIYEPDSNVFHKYTCEKMYTAKEIAGAVKYDTVIKTGRVPCTHCNPTAVDMHKAMDSQLRTLILKNRSKGSTDKDNNKAIVRQKTAVAERNTRLRNSNLTDIQKSDIYTLTQPRYGFWAGQGHQSFHLRACPNLKGVTHLKGFSTYDEALRAGYTPCRHCKPHKKHDINISIPIVSTLRENEKIEDILPLCTRERYSYYFESEFLYLETPVGKWRIKIGTYPIKIEHINLVNAPKEEMYHEQPRIFLSFTDVFRYIKRHDETLMRRK